MADRLPPAQPVQRPRRPQPLHRRDIGGGLARAHPRLVRRSVFTGAVASPWAGAGDAFGRIELWLYAALAGLLFRAPGTWLGFWTINRTGVQTYLIALSAMPFFAIALEATAAHPGWVAPPNLSVAEWIAAAVILAASIWLIIVRLKASAAP